MKPIPKRCYGYGLATLAHIAFTLISPFYTVRIVLWLMKRNLYRLTIAAFAAPVFLSLLVYSFKQWRLIKKNKRLVFILISTLLAYVTVYETVPDLGEKLHVLNFSVLAILVYKACSPLMKLHWALLISWLTASIVAGIDEYMQNFISGRVGTVHDVLIAVRSGILGGIIGWIFDAYSRKGR